MLNGPKKTNYVNNWVKKIRAKVAEKSVHTKKKEAKINYLQAKGGERPIYLVTAGASKKE